MARGDLHSHASNRSALSHLGHLEISFKGLINQKNDLLIALVSELSALKHFDLMQKDKMLENYFEMLKTLICLYLKACYSKPHTSLSCVIKSEMAGSFVEVVYQSIQVTSPSIPSLRLKFT